MTRIALITAAAIVCLSGAQAQVEATFEIVDTNADGYVSQGEFVSWQTASGEVTVTEATIKFVEIDTDGSGSITLAEMSAAMKGKTDEETS
ncbi:MAG: EF-hand domain-containing protein [Henriciella sp.]|nr:EF-hand domain-containing protein [Henriciella sp.]